MTTLMQIVQACENYLGWQPPYRQDTPPWRTLGLEVHKLRRAMAKHPAQKVTTRNLALALEYSRKRRLPLSAPSTLIYRIDEALELAAVERTVQDVDTRIAAAIALEQDREDAESLRWIYRLKRACGPGREQALAEWKAAGRG